MAEAAGHELAGRCGVVLGGGGGIGRAVVLDLAARGARLVSADRDPDRAETTAQLADTNGADVVADTCDVARLDSVEGLNARVVDRFGRIDFIVLAAGVTQSGGIVDADASQWEDLLRINVLGVAHVLRVFLPALRRSGDGIAVVVSSLSGRETYPGQPLYIASKWATVGLTASVRKEAQSWGVRVTLVEPGLVDTPMSRANPYAQQQFESVEPLAPEDVAAAVRFALQQPRHVLVREVAVQPVGQWI